MTTRVNETINFAYGYDSNGNITSQMFDHRTSDPVQTYTYDTLDRLTGLFLRLRSGGLVNQAQVYHPEQQGGQEGIAGGHPQAVGMA